jgi:hypothetical protein
LFGLGCGQTFAPVYIKPIYKYQKSTGERVVSYRLVESYRCDNGTRHHTILHLGRLEELPDVEQKRALSIRLNDLVKQSYTGIQSLFISEAVVEALAQKFFKQIQEQQRLDLAEGKDIQPIDTESIKGTSKNSLIFHGNFQNSFLSEFAIFDMYCF